MSEFIAEWRHFQRMLGVVLSYAVLLTALLLGARITWQWTKRRRQARRRRCFLCGVQGWDGAAPITNQDEPGHEWRHVAELTGDGRQYCQKCALAVVEARAIFANLRAREERKRRA